MPNASSLTKKQRPKLTGKVVYLPHNHTPEMERLFQRGISELNNVINQLELKGKAMK